MEEHITIVNIWSKKYRQWWKAGGFGYTKDRSLAGNFAEDQARNIVDDPFSSSVVVKLTEGPPK